MEETKKLSCLEISNIKFYRYEDCRQPVDINLGKHFRFETLTAKTLNTLKSYWPLKEGLLGVFVFAVKSIFKIHLSTLASILEK